MGGFDPAGYVDFDPYYYYLIEFVASSFGPYSFEYIPASKPPLRVSWLV